jgi:hypothetical protein
MPNEPSLYEIHRLTAFQRDMLIEHVDGPVDVTVRDHRRVCVRDSLITNGMLRPDHSGPRPIRPKATILTERGRYALAAVLAHYAESLIRAGMLERSRPIEVLARIKAENAKITAERAETALLPARLAMGTLRK